MEFKLLRLRRGRQAADAEQSAKTHFDLWSNWIITPAGRARQFGEYARSVGRQIGRSLNSTKKQTDKGDLYYQVSFVHFKWTLP